METGVLLIVGLIEVGILAFVMNMGTSKGRSSVRAYMTKLTNDNERKSELKRHFEHLYGQMIDVGSLRNKAEEFLSYQESLKAERGRITITQAELETVEGRQRELEEIERELEASGIETREEINILEKKQQSLSAKNKELYGQINESTKKMETVLTEIEMSAQMQEQVNAMKGQLLSTQEKMDHLLTEIEQGNEQYFILKKRYDALDIEYAQLYEKFAAMEDG